MATYAGILDNVRKAFAKANAVDAALFSANSGGACPDCNGLGIIYSDLAHLDPMVTTCETCDSKRFLPEVLQRRLGGKSMRGQSASFNTFAVVEPSKFLRKMPECVGMMTRSNLFVLAS